MEEMRNAQGDCPTGLSPATLPAQESQNSNSESSISTPPRESHNFNSEASTSTPPAQESHNINSASSTSTPPAQESHNINSASSTFTPPAQESHNTNSESSTPLPAQESHNSNSKSSTSHGVNGAKDGYEKEMPTDSEMSAAHDNPCQLLLEKNAASMTKITHQSGPRFETVSTSSTEALGTQNYQSSDAPGAQSSNNISHHYENGDSLSTAPVQVEDVASSPPSVMADTEIIYTENNICPRPCDVSAVPQVGVASVLQQTPELVFSPRRLKDIKAGKSLIDTAAPIESVKEAVSKYGGIVDWKAHKILTVERRKHVEVELEKAQEDLPRYKKQTEAADESKEQVLNELDHTRKLMDALKLNVEKAQTEANQAKQDCELARLRTEELEKGIANEASIAAKAQLEVARARHATAVADLKSVKDEIEALKADYVSLASDSVISVKKADEAASALKESEKMMEELTLEMIAAKGSLESAQAIHLEAEEKRIAASIARQEDASLWQKRLKRAEEELQEVNSQVSLTKDLKSKLDMATELLRKQKAELEAIVEGKLQQETSAGKEDYQVGETKEKAAMSPAEELKVVTLNIEKAKDKINCLRVAAESIKSELDREKVGLAAMRQREGMASITVATLEAELCGLQAQLESVQAKEKEAKERVAELPAELHEASQAAEQARMEVITAHEELRKAKEVAEQAKASESTAGSRLNAVLKEIEAAKASERLAVAAAKALQESEMAASEETDDLTRIKLPFQDYCALSKQAHEAEEEANLKVAAALAQIEVARKSESRSLERVEEANREKTEKAEALRIAMDKADKANEGKLGVEQELRKWRADGEQRRKASDVSGLLANYVRNSTESTDAEQDAVDSAPKPPASVNNKANDEAEVKNSKAETKTKKKKAFFPRFIMFMTRKKSHSSN